MVSTASIQRQEFARHVVDAMRLFGPVQAKAMFGGHGLYRDGLMFAILQGGQLYLKADADSEAVFAERGLPPFVYEARGKTHALGYRLAPPEVFDEPAEMMRWAALGYECALRHARKPSAGGKPGKRGAVSAGRPALAGGSEASRGLGGVECGDVPGSAAAVLPCGGQRPQAESLAELPNLGDKSREMLERAGIGTPAELARLGAVVAYARVKAQDPGASLNLLWALEGALSGRPWQQVAATDRASLLMALEDVQKALPPGALPAAPGRARATPRRPGGGPAGRR